MQIKSKIICTIGPKTQSCAMLGSLVDAGMGVMRCNFSHGTHEYHQKTIDNLASLRLTNKNARLVAVLLDTKGPEIRSGKLEGHVDHALVAGSEFVFHADQTVLGNSVQV